jgi:hypothetical protein
LLNVCFGNLPNLGLGGEALPYFLNFVLEARLLDGVVELECCGAAVRIRDVDCGEVIPEDSGRTEIAVQDALDNHALSFQDFLTTMS